MCDSVLFCCNCQFEVQLVIEIAIGHLSNCNCNQLLHTTILPMSKGCVCNMRLASCNDYQLLQLTDPLPDFVNHKSYGVLLCAKGCSKMGSPLRGDFHTCVSKGCCCIWMTVLLGDKPGLLWIGEVSKFFGPSVLMWSHHSPNLLIFPEPEALSAYQTWFISLTLPFSFLIRGMVA